MYKTVYNIETHLYKNIFDTADGRCVKKIYFKKRKFIPRTYRDKNTFLLLNNFKFLTQREFFLCQKHEYKQNTLLYP